MALPSWPICILQRFRVKKGDDQPGYEGMPSCKLNETTVEFLRRIIMKKASACSKITAAILAALMATGVLTGCSKSSATSEPSSSVPVTIKILLQGSEINQIQKIEDEFYKRTKGTLNMKVEIDSIMADQYASKLKLEMTGGDTDGYDLVFDAPWLSLPKLASEGAYTDLSQYFNNSKYPGLQANFSQEFIKANLVNGKMYAIPLTNNYYDIPGIIYRTDLAKKYGISKITNNDDLKKYFEAVLNDKSMSGAYPLGISNSQGFYEFLEDGYSAENKAGIFEVSGVLTDSSQRMFYAAISSDGKKVLDIATLGDSDSKFANFPSPYNKNFIDTKYVQYAQWAKYIEPDSTAQTDASGNLFCVGKTAATTGTLNDVSSVAAKIAKAVSGATVDFYAYNSYERNMEKGAMYTEYKAWNDICIPTDAPHKEQAITFLNWLFSSQSNHDLFELGIEGTNWKSSGTKEYTIPSTTDASTNYNIPQYELTWNPNMTRISAELPTTANDLLKYEMASDSYSKIPFSGFTFDPSNVKTQIAQLDSLEKGQESALICGQYSETETQLKKFNQKAESAGLETVRAEIKKQLQAYLDKNNS
jgi:putative aldouronate transport system substrate-binding protein